MDLFRMFIVLISLLCLSTLTVGTPPVDKHRPDARNYVHEKETNIIHNEDEGVAHKTEGFELSFTRVTIYITRRLLRLLQKSGGQCCTTFEKRSVLAPPNLARDSFKLGLMVYMGYNNEDECRDRLACETGDILSRLTSSAPAVLSVMNNFVPEFLKQDLIHARIGALGETCEKFRCGDKPPEEHTVTPEE